MDVTQPGQYKVVYTVKDPDNGEVLESLERFVTVNEGGFIHGGQVAYADRLDGQIVDDRTIVSTVGDPVDGPLFVDNAIISVTPGLPLAMEFPRRILARAVMAVVVMVDTVAAMVASESMTATI